MTHVTPTFDAPSSSVPISSMSEPAPILTSRGARFASIWLAPIILIVTLAEVAAFVAFLQRRMTWPEYIGAAFVGIVAGAVGAIGLIKPVIDGWTKQDVAKIEANAPKQEAPQAVATVTNVTDAHTTPAETPIAKRDTATQ